MSDLQSTIFALRLVQLLLLIPLMALAGQGLLYLLTRGIGQPPQNNFFYRILQIISSPFVKLVRLITPKFVNDNHIPFAVFGILLACWAWTTVEIANTCVRHGMTVRACLDGQ